MNIKVLGSGCKNCEALLKAVKEAVDSNNIEVDIEYITAMEKVMSYGVMSYGVMSMPALVVNDKVVSAGTVLKAEEVKRFLV